MRGNRPIFYDGVGDWGIIMHLHLYLKNFQKKFQKKI